MSEEKEFLNTTTETEKSAERRVFKPDIRSFFDYTTPEMLKRRAVKEILALENEQKKEARMGRFGLSSEATEGEIVAAIERRIGEYQTRIAEAKVFIPEQLKKTNEWLEGNQLHPKQPPENVSVRIVDSLLAIGVPGGDIEDVRSQYKPDANIIMFNPEEGWFIPAHEYMHAMGSDKEGRVVGFRYINERNEIKGNRWLDEGTAMIGEFATNSAEDRGRDRERTDGYEFFYWMTQQFIRELGITEAELLRAFFDQDGAREEFEKKVKERFNCTTEDLAIFPMAYSEEEREMVVRMLKGDAMTLTVPDNEHAKEKYNALAELFPNIKIRIRTAEELAELVQKIKNT
ncbi:TPA: hypothetical protein DDZ49_03255 [Candidatus Wolfebacteria bacterium]|uniref:Uncharacterized protein n=2 Tax=Candidatus Wolfeibacteriota TaxID=1752735 RepID=A0A0G1WJ59_9BACT|nr:MAG: hypothetical protein UX70_C0001G0237 [Candidatus Wolfebacteria bacterium GW2011_GWB1_47_1]KKU42037.1 MAG: hypothetical protein UX58_C0004G0096 [Candidatus Wolfebacteria bacterium GW2011_GWB2_46_69]KKU54426.1 MAG: hypothetical protein UX76_C0002G0019 [Candidatus Wolfebacteria bacterium GW2011_GWC1_47_103]KKU59754.1 MAG: hypothetical protein UX83_C0002G0041 [Candidatus Wolfebacteria bacterium GW2011_GWE2_47_12]KKU65745.1 MAG: hypothetical protein UX90_C0002G0121 [Candidatus Wolfebacteria 